MTINLSKDEIEEFVGNLIDVFEDYLTTNGGVVDPVDDIYLLGDDFDTISNQIKQTLYLWSNASEGLQNEDI